MRGNRRTKLKRKSHRPPAGPRKHGKPAHGRRHEPERLQSRSRAARKERGVAIVHGFIEKNRRGFAFLLHKPEDLFVPPGLAAKLLSGDRVKAWVDSRSREILKLEIEKRAVKAFIGVYEAGIDARIVYLTDRTMREEVLIRERPGIEGLRHGHKVLVEITKYEPHLEGRIVRSFGSELAPKHDTFAVVVRSGWPQEFSSAATREAEAASSRIQHEAAANGYRGRKDHRTKPFITIDGRDARDFDDAICVEKTDAGFILYVAIADVSEFVTPGSVVDAEAYERATSVYFPEWVIPMLPEALSNGACSLRPDEEKLVLTCEMHFDASGKKKSARVYEAVIRSHRRCIYEDVQREADKGEAFWQHTYALFRKLRHQRIVRGSLDLDLPEAKVILDENSDTTDIRKEERVDSHRLIEEFMIAANESVTELMERAGWPFVYRVHEPPGVEALERFERFASALGLKPKLAGVTDPRKFSAFLETIGENPMAQTLYYLLLRSLKQARYEPVNLKHFGLASGAYTHFTSPIRRYPDLMVHRILKRFVRRNDYRGAELEEFEDYLMEACEHCSRLERRAEQLDRMVTRVKMARFMNRQMGEVLSARITNASEAGLQVEIDRWYVDGLVPIAELGDDYFEFVEERLLLRGKRSGKRYRVGDTIQVSVLRTDVDNGYIDFTLAE